MVKLKRTQRNPAIVVEMLLKRLAEVLKRNGAPTELVAKIQDRHDPVNSDLIRAFASALGIKGKKPPRPRKNCKNRNKAMFLRAPLVQQRGDAPRGNVASLDSGDMSWARS